MPFVTLRTKICALVSGFILGTEVGEILLMFERDRFRLGKANKLGASETDLVRIEIVKTFVIRAVCVIALIIKADVNGGHCEHSNEISDPDVCDFGFVHSSFVRDQCLRAADPAQAN